MEARQYSIRINASKEKVWNTLWEDQTFRDWAGIIDEGTYMEGEMKKDGNVHFISSSSGYGVTSKITDLAIFETVTFRHMKDTKERGTQERDDEWTGGSECYVLEETNGATILTVHMDVPEELAELLNIRVPKALERVKILSERPEH